MSLYQFIKPLLNRLYNPSACLFLPNLLSQTLQILFLYVGVAVHLFSCTIFEFIGLYFIECTFGNSSKSTGVINKKYGPGIVCADLHCLRGHLKQNSD